MVLLPDSGKASRTIADLAKRSFIGKAVDLYGLAQRYLYNSGKLAVMDDAYLAITPNEGGFARKGFYLKTSDGAHADKSGTYYVDLTSQYIDAPPDKLMSITQLYPHELGHIMYRLLSATDSAEQQSSSVTVHYFSLLTDHSTAFNEGFAEHIENISRLFEPDSAIRKGIMDDLAAKSPFLQSCAQGFVRDFTWPARLDYFKSTMLVWFQQFEDYKRYQHAVDGTVAFKNGYPALDDPADMISIRNAGVYQQATRRNAAEIDASEGMVSAFFTKMAMAGAGKVYASPGFYRPFQADTTAAGPERYTLDEIENLFAKYFYVLNKYVVFEGSRRPQLTDFIEGYMKEFPDEGPQVAALFQELTGAPFDPDPRPSLWYMSQTHSHRVLALDALDAITIPVYTFDINAADDIDLLTIGGISQDEASIIVQYRTDHGFFNTYAEVESIPGLTDHAREVLAGSQIDKTALEGLFTEDLKLGPLLRAPFIHLLEQATLWFIPIAGLIYVTTVRKRKLSVKGLLGTGVSYFFMWLLLVLAGAVLSIINGNTWMVFACFGTLYLVPGLVILRKRADRAGTFLLASVLMLAVIGYSLI
jgi:hypothetical protein